MSPCPASPKAPQIPTTPVNPISEFYRIHIRRTLNPQNRDRPVLCRICDTKLVAAQTRLHVQIAIAAPRHPAERTGRQTAKNPGFTLCAHSIRGPHEGRDRPFGTGHFSVSIADGHRIRRIGIDQFCVAYATQNWSRPKLGSTCKSPSPPPDTRRSGPADKQPRIPVLRCALTRFGARTKAATDPLAPVTFPYPSQTDTESAELGSTNFMSHMRHETGRDPNWAPAANRYRRRQGSGGSDRQTKSQNPGFTLCAHLIRGPHEGRD